MPNPNPFLRPALDAMLAAATRARAARGRPFLASENIGLRGMDFPGPSAMPTMPRPSVLTREQEFQAGRVRLPDAPDPGMPPGGFSRPINPPEIAGGMEIPKAPLSVGESRELPEGFKITYTRAGRIFVNPAHEFEVIGPTGDMRVVRLSEMQNKPGIALASIKYLDPSRPDALLSVPSGQPTVPNSVVRGVIGEIRDALPHIHTVLGSRTAGAHARAADRLFGADPLRAFDVGTQKIRLRRPFLEQ